MYYQPYPFYMPNMNQMQIPPCMRNADWIGGAPNLNQPEEAMPEYQLEMMYPKTYYIIYPEVVHHCDMFDKECCSMNLPTQEEIERMVDNIAMKAEAEVEASMKSEMREDEMRQLGFGGRGLLRDLVGVLLLREFFQRRHRPHRRRHQFPYRMGY